MARQNSSQEIEIPTEEMSRLYSVGFFLIPFGGGKDGKSPLLSFSADSRIPFKSVLGPMYHKGSSCCGIRLENLAVLDCDIADPKLVTTLEQRFGTAHVHVKTPLGWHLYYANDTSKWPNLRDEGLPVDVKHGARSYVVGPNSIRPDGGIYTPSKGILGESQLSRRADPLFRSRPASSAGAIPEGFRNQQLFLRSIEMVEHVSGQKELFENLIFIRDEECENPDTFTDAEVAKIAKWTWERRLSNKIYQGRMSEFRVNRYHLDLLNETSNASDSKALYVHLESVHGHRFGHTFALKHCAMRAANHTDLSRDRFRKAIKSLVNVGLLKVASKHEVGKKPKTYRLARPIDKSSNVTALR